MIYRNVNLLIKHLFNFTQLKEVEIKSETFEHITCEVTGSKETLDKIKRLYQLCEKINVGGFTLENQENDRIELLDIEDNINDENIHFIWKFSINKLDWFSFHNYKITAFFKLENFDFWLNSIEVLDQDNAFMTYKNLQIILPMKDNCKVEGYNFVILEEVSKTVSIGMESELPNDQIIKQHVHLLSSESIVFNPRCLALKLEETEEKFIQILQQKYAEALLISLVQVYKSNNEVVLKGLKYLTLYVNENVFPPVNIIKTIEKAVNWVYKENVDTRLKLLVDRLSINSNQYKNLMQVAIDNIDDAFAEAKDRYGFIISQKSEEFTKDLRDLLKDTKEQSNKYIDKTRAIITSLLRDTLAAIFFLGLTVYARFSNNTSFLFSLDANFIFILLGSYFFISMVVQVMFNIWDQKLSEEESKQWSKSTLDYMTKETFKKYFTDPLMKRTKQFNGVQVTVMLIYALLVILSFNAQSIAHYFSD